MRRDSKGRTHIPFRFRVCACLQKCAHAQLQAHSSGAMQRSVTLLSWEQNAVGFGFLSVNGDRCSKISLMMLAAARGTIGALARDC